METSKQKTRNIVKKHFFLVFTFDQGKRNTLFYNTISLGLDTLVKNIPIIYKLKFLNLVS